MAKFRLMKPATLKDLESLPYPILGCIKFDGIRGTVTIDGNKLTVYSNSLKPVRNKEVQLAANNLLDAALDFEMVLTDSKGNHAPFHETTSYVMSADKTLRDLPNLFKKDNGSSTFESYHLTFFIFDYWMKPDKPFAERLGEIFPLVRDYNPNNPFNVKIAEHEILKNPDQVMEFYQNALDKGLEGVILRHPQGRYKYGRSTLKEAYSIKMKGLEDMEGTIVGFTQRRVNLSPSFINERGFREKSKKLEYFNILPEIGRIIVDCPEFGQVSIGTGFSRTLAKDMYENSDKYLGKTVTFTYVLSGTKDKPRSPAFKGFRNLDDI